MKKLLQCIYVGILGLNLFFASWFVLHGDIEFSSDIARDFFLLEEVHRKKFVLIGPKSSTGLFHGPLWLYLNYPAYALGNGNPVVVGWWWIALTGLFVGSSFFIAKKLFGEKTAYIFTLMISVYTVFHAHRYFNPHGAMFLTPLFFYLFIRYLQTHYMKYLITHILIAGAIIQFQMAVGIPLFILSSLVVVFQTVKTKRRFHALALLLIIVPLLNFIVFDLRHEHLLSKQLLHYAVSPGRDYPNYLELVKERARLAITASEILRRDPGYRNFVLFAVLLTLLVRQVTDKKYKRIYIYFLYFYFGFFILSLFNTGKLLYFYLFPLFPLVLLIFSSFVTSRHCKIFLVLFFFVFTANLSSAIGDTQDAKATIGKSENSWKFLAGVANAVYQNGPKTFGYFVYAPDVVAFGPKYAMLYAQKRFPQYIGHYFQKMSVTYLVIAPPPRDNPYMQDAWWRINLLHIAEKPVKTIHFDNGYKIEKYILNDTDIKVPVEPNIDPGIIFR